MHKIAAAGTTEPLVVPTGTVVGDYRFRFIGPSGAPAVPDVIAPYADSSAGPVSVVSDPVTAPGLWTVSFALLDAGGAVLGTERTATVDVPPDVVLRVAAGLTVQVIAGS